MKFFPHSLFSELNSFSFHSFDFSIDIQEFYELTLLDDTKTIQQKTVETLQIATKWEQENSLKLNAAEVRTQCRKLVVQSAATNVGFEFAFRRQSSQSYKNIQIP